MRSGASANRDGWKSRKLTRCSDSSRPRQRWRGPRASSNDCGPRPIFRIGCVGRLAAGPAVHSSPVGSVSFRCSRGRITRGIRARRGLRTWSGVVALTHRQCPASAAQHPPSPPPSLLLFISLCWSAWLGVDDGSTRSEFAQAAMASRLPNRRSLTNRLPYTAAISPWRLLISTGRQPGRARSWMLPARRRLTRPPGCGGLLASSTEDRP